MATSQIFASMLDGMAPMWIELSFLVCFLLGFIFLRLDAFPFAKKPKKVVDTPKVIFDQKLKKVIETEAASGSPAAVLKAWRAGKALAPTPHDILKCVVQAFVDADPSAAAAELIAHMRQHATSLRNSKVAAVLLDVVARAGRTEVMMELWDSFQKVLAISPSCLMYEILLGGWASVGDEAKVEEIFQELESSRIKLTARGFSLTIKGFLKNGLVDAVLKRLLQMKNHGLHVPPFAVAQFLRIACDAGRLFEVFDQVYENLPLPPEAIALLVEDACRRNDMDFAKRIEKICREAKQPLPSGAYDPLLKLCTLHSDVHAIELFKEMQEAGVRISEGLCVGLLARCAETKFLRFAEEVVKFSQARGGMTIAIYSALMKVYAYCSMYDKACALYDQIRADGLEPDSMMYGCLMKFSVECGRTDLSRELSERAPSLDIQNYMSLIRAAGRDKDVDRAFSVLAKLSETGMTLDVAAYNCVLDVCVSAGDMDRARALVKEMKEANSSIDIITYNTLMKGYCSCGDLASARELMKEMEATGHPPNDVSYNCLVNAAVTHGNGNFREAWDTIDLMERNGVVVDHYTISIMMKALKKVKNPRDVARALALLDRSNIDICSDEILLNTVLETCIRHRELRRLEGMLTSYERSSLKPQVHTYGSLIKACSTLKRVEKSWQFWQEMEEYRGIEPNDIVLGCMLDALVCNNCVDEAVELFSKWKDRVKPNTVIYSTLIKGFANTHQADRAMNFWKEMRGANIQMNTVVYNAVIDAQARMGAMDEVSMLVEAMEPDGCRPDVITYSTIVKGYCVKGDLDKAFQVFRSMQNNNMANDSIIYNTVLDGCTRHSRFDLADDLLADMERLKVAPSNFTLGILVKMYGRRKMLDRAFEAVETLPNRFGFSANAQVSTCLMCACLNNGAVDRAFQVFEDLKRSSKGADAKAYVALISGCIRQNQLQKAHQLVEEAYGLIPGSQKICEGETEPVEQLLRAYSQRGLLEQQGVPLLERLRIAKVQISGRVFGSAFGGSAGGSNNRNGGYGNGGHGNRGCGTGNRGGGRRACGNTNNW
mmetsp:Transcript_43732/g.136783  ORF Transcript_43732/g.136783 Transcript_43732/m.136783 type:complete len:1055 (-) Transcript_43732:65-3229(-)